VTAGGNPLNDAMELFAKPLAERRKGRIKVDVHIANALAKGEGAHLEGVQLGTIDVVAIGSAPVGGMFEPLYQSLDLPFLWSSREQVWKVMDGPLGQELLKKMESKNLKAFCFGGGWGFRNMMSNKRPITTPVDMKGQTIRVQESPTYVAMMKAGVQINDVKDITAFQGLMKPAYDYVERQVGKEFMTRLRAAVQAATK
jgi:TRAP-type C4-dicarboxylate transport system substrate-binding protein